MFIQTLCLIFSPVDFCLSPSGEMDEQTSQAWIFVVAKQNKSVSQVLSMLWHRAWTHVGFSSYMSPPQTVGYSLSWINCCIQSRCKRSGWKNKAQTEDPQDHIGCYNNRQGVYTSSVFCHSMCMVSIVENPPICAVSHSHAHGEVVMMEIVVLLFHSRVSPHHFLMQNWGLSPIHLLPAADMRLS